MISITWFGMAFGMGANKKLGVVMGFVMEIDMYRWYLYMLD